MILTTEGLSKSFGGVQAVKELSLGFEAGLITGVIGPNGAGKSTLINLLDGSTAPTTGSIRLAGKPITHMARHKISLAGIARTYQTSRLFEHLTALENLEVCFYPLDSSLVWREVISPSYGRKRDTERREHCMAILERLGIAHFAQTEARRLPYGRQRILEIARAIVRKPRVLLLDEPAAGLNHEETADLKQRLDNMRAPDLAMVIVEHDMDLIMTVCDRIHVLNFGQLLFSGKPRQVQNDPAVLAAYLGTTDEYNRIYALAQDRRSRVGLRPRQDS